MAANWAQWLLVNIGKACRWRGNTTQYRDGCGNTYNSSCTAGGHDCEGGVDIPLSAGTPIYALAGGTLIGNGPWKGHGVITTDVQGVGKLYYQHLDVLPSFPQCVNGNCPAVYIPQGTLLGYSNADAGEVEVGINPAWGGIWGPPNNGSNWVADPRAALVALANGNTSSTPITPASTFSGNCPDGGVSDQCCKNCQQFNIFDPRRAVCFTQEAVCMGQQAATTVGSTASTFTSIWAQLGPWLGDPVRLLKLIGGAAGLFLGVLALFWPTVQQASQVAVGQAARVGGFKVGGFKGGAK